MIQCIFYLIFRKTIGPCSEAITLKEYTVGHPNLVKETLLTIRKRFVETEDSRCCLLYRDYINCLDIKDYIYAPQLMDLIYNLKNASNYLKFDPEKIDIIIKEIKPYCEFITPEEFALSLFEAVEKLIAHDTIKLFLFPVTEIDVPGYSKVIKEPMDYHTLESKLLNNKYITFDDFKRDLFLIYQNAYKFNELSPQIIKNTRIEEEFATTTIKDIKIARDPGYLVDIIMIILCPYYTNMFLQSMITLVNENAKQPGLTCQSKTYAVQLNTMLLLQSIWKPIITSSISV